MKNRITENKKVLFYLIDFYVKIKIVKYKNIQICLNSKEYI